MNDFQAAERKRLEEPASEIGLEPLCAMVCELSCLFLSSLNTCSRFLIDDFLQILLKQINNNLRCYDLAMELSNSTLEALPQNYAEQVCRLNAFTVSFLFPHP